MTMLTLADWARRIDPDGKVPSIVEILSETNEILDDMIFVEGNLPTGHRTTVRSGLPSVAWRLLNYGVQPSKSTTVQVDDSIGMLEAYSEIDKDLADLNGNTAAFRLTEDTAFLEAMSEEMAATVFYGDTTTDPEKFLGLDARFNDATAPSGKNIVNARGAAYTAGTAENTSIWLVAWSPTTVHGIFPKGSKAGLIHQDLGEVTLTDASGGRFQGYRARYQWKLGLTVRDWRYVVRVANIKTSALTKSGSAFDLVDLMLDALGRIKALKGRPAFYVSRTVKSFLRRQIVNKDNVMLSFDSVGGKEVLTFAGIPVRLCEGISDTETGVTFT
jgi:hypothetical protein